MAKKLTITRLKAKSAIHVKIKTSVGRTIVAWSWSKKNYSKLSTPSVGTERFYNLGALLAKCAVTQDVMLGDTNIKSGLNAGGCGA